MRECPLLMSDQQKRETMGRLSKEYVAENIGASQKIVDTIERELK